MFQWMVKKKDSTPAEVKLEQIKNILFPPLKLVEEMDKDGTTLKFHIDYSVDSNLDSALLDLQENINDKATQSTIDQAVKALFKVRKLLEAYSDIDSEAKYIIVDNTSPEDPDIIARD